MDVVLVPFRGVFKTLPNIEDGAPSYMSDRVLNKPVFLTILVYSVHQSCFSLVPLFPYFGNVQENMK